MVMTDIGKSGLGLLLGPSGSRPTYLSIGSGSGAVAVGNTNLIAEVTGVTPTTTDISVAKEITWTSDFSSVTMSGTQLREFGMKISGGNVWNREGFAALTFDGTSELQVQVSFQVF